LTLGPLRRARTAVAEFIQEKFRVEDFGGIVADGKLLNNRFTKDRAELLRATQSFAVPNDTRPRLLLQREWPRIQDEEEAARIDRRDPEALQTAIRRACVEDPTACGKSTAIVENLVEAKARESVADVRTRTLQTLSVLDVLSRGLARIPGPKTVVLFSEGFILLGHEAELRQAVGQAARAGVHFYAIDARGLDRAGGSAIIDQPVAFDASGPSVKFDLQADGTNSLAVDTGGFAIRNENNFGRALDEIQRDAGTYYVVGYTPVKDTFDGKYRQISVRVARPGVKVRARRGYLAIDPARLLRPTPVTTATVPSRASALPAPVMPEVPVSPGLIALPDNVSVTLPGETPALPEKGTASTGAVHARIDTGRMVLALGKDATVPSGPAERGWRAFEKGDVETAARELGTATQAVDARPWVVYVLGLSHFALRHYPDAAQAWERVRREVPEFEPIYFSLADTYGLQHEEGTALKVLREAERRWPADSEVANAIGVIQIRRGALDAAIASFERATTTAPDDSLGYFNLARTHQMRLLKSQRYDPQMQKWIGGDEDRRRAIANFQKYLQLGGAYERQAREALSALGWS
jgi:VWFA-related protein